MKTATLYKLIHNVLAAIGLCSLLAGGFGVYLVAKSYHLPPRLLALKVMEKLDLEQTALAEYLRPDPVRPAGLALPDLEDPNWQGHGARADRQMQPVVYDLQGRPVPRAWLEHGREAYPAQGAVRIVAVRGVADFRQAIKQAQPGDEIRLQSGVYRIKARNIEIMHGGSVQQPVVVKAERLGAVIIELDSLEGFWINAPYWTFENLEIRGIAQNHDYGEHAFHIVGRGKGFVLRNSRVYEFNAMIKANGLRQQDGKINFPDDALIENNHLFNSQIRNTSHPVTLIDVVGPDNWTVRGNLIADFAKGDGDRISYGAFLKGNSSNGVFENNLVIGEYNTSGGVRVGLSLGGGGSGAKFARNSSNEYEHTDGIIRNNIVMYCSDVGLYLNRARNTRVYNNTFYRTMGVDVRFPTSSAVLRNNLLSSRIKNRDGGVSEAEQNIFADPEDFSQWFKRPEYGDFSLKNGQELVDAGVDNKLIMEDLCGEARVNKPDIGALEFNGMQGCTPLLDSRP